ncbi:O-methyltransferase [Exidia glandulosa HHB12029]|uniref:O-methyltransferase n=1 Tax=Exidia glandulosa HHB12029 TaxID=1314781 RepID=A0A165F668_EXIGL|nr:O-methyltransferase [Exidia glandulosa HHB12029]
MTIAELKLLAGIINSSIATLERELGSTDFPSLDAAYDPESTAEKALTAEPVAHALDLIVAASSQLCASTRAPALSILEITWQNFLSAALDFVCHVNVVEILREAGPGGMHVRDMALKTDVDPERLSHALRLCATFHVFREVSPDVFANNRLSSTLDTGKSYVDTPPVPSRMTNPHLFTVRRTNTTDMMTLGARSITSQFTDPSTKNASEPNVTALGRAHGFQGKTMFAWFEEAQNADVRKCFELAMPATTLWEIPNAIVRGFDWQSLPSGSLVVDVGGNVGNMMMPLHENFPHLRFEVQDRKQACETGTKLWNAKYPDAIASGKMHFRAHDFFAEEPVKDAAVFMLRNVVHNWPDDYVVKILSRLRDAAAPSTQLLIVDHILPYATKSADAVSDIPGAAIPEVPEPLLPNLGRASSNAYIIDMCMQVTCNGRDRTVSEHLNVLERAGWKIVRINRVGKDVRFGYIVAAPA